MGQVGPDTLVQPDQHQERLRADRRLLGRLLGEVIREQVGAETLELVENIRRSAVILRRGDTPGQDSSPVADARRSLETALPRTRRATHLTINGVAAGLRNNG